MQNVNAAQLVPVLRPLMPQAAHMAAYPNGNILILSDRASNVSRVMRIIQRIDQAGRQRRRHHQPAARLVQRSRARGQHLLRAAGPGRRRRRLAVARHRRRPLQQRAGRRREIAAPAHQGADRASRHAARKRRRHAGALPAIRRCGKDRHQAQGTDQRDRGHHHRRAAGGRRGARAVSRPAPTAPPPSGPSRKPTRWSSPRRRRSCAR